MAATSSQLSSFSAIHRKFFLQQRALLYPSFRPQKSWVVLSVDGRGANTTSSEIETTLSYTADESKHESKPYVEGTTKSSPIEEEEHAAGVTGANEQVQEDGVLQQKRGAKIHDFCFGIPYGGLVLGGGLIGLIFSRNPATFRNIIIGGGLLTLSTFSLKTWRQGKSSLPHILGQAVLSAILLWKNYETYILTKKLIPTAFYAAISAAMLCFYSYVVISGGNPPPKKQKSPAVAPS